MSKKTEVVIPEGTEASVVETVGGKRVAYKAQIKENEHNENDFENNNGESELFNGEGGASFNSQSDAPEIPTTPLENLFKQIRLAVIDQRLPDTFYASVVRQPDEIGARYNVPCNGQIDLGVFTFTSRDQFNFVGAIQTRNGNSGGVVNVRIYKMDRSPLTVRMHQFAGEGEVGLLNFGVPNPIPEPTPAAAAPQENLLASVMREMQSSNQQFQERMLQIMQQTNRHEPSALEKALEQKVIHDLTNPPTSNRIEETLANLMVMPIMAERMAKRMFPDPVAAPELPQPDWFDKAERLAESKFGNMLLPAAVNMIEKFGDTAQAFAESKLIPDAPNPSGELSESEIEKTDMQIFIEGVVSELESDRKLDASNEFIQTLRTDYEGQADDLITLCQTFPFESVVVLMINKAKKMRPNPFVEFIDVDASQQQGKYVFNDRGQLLMPRLQEFYEYVKTLDV